MTPSDRRGSYQPQRSRPDMSLAPELKLNNDYLIAPRMIRFPSDSSTSSIISNTFSFMDPSYQNYQTPLESMASSPSSSYTEFNPSQSYASYQNPFAQSSSPAEPSYLSSPIATSFTKGSMNDNLDLLPRGYSSTTTLAASSMLPATISPYLPSLEDGERRASTELFDIEKDGDPAIKWEMYYDFYVDKEGAYYKLQDGYLPTEKYPAKRTAEPFRSSTGQLRYPCKFVQGRNPCGSKPFKRPFDLERHFRTVHSKHLKTGETWECDYVRCSHKDSFQRQDHCREHYREYHREDLIKRNLRGSSAQVWLKDRNVNAGWWRCSKCLKRNYLIEKERVEEWKCECGVAAEKERVEAREKRIRKEKEKANVKAEAVPELQLASAQWGCDCLGGWYEDGAGEMVECSLCQLRSSDVRDLMMGDAYPGDEDEFPRY